MTTEYVGIAPSLEKTRLLNEGDYAIEVEDLHCLTFDCERHIHFLQCYLNKKETFNAKRTLYYAYYDFFRGSDVALQKSKSILEYFLFLRKSPEILRKEVIAVMDDGNIRLDGAHRASIAYVLGHKSIKVKRYLWESIFSRREISNILDEGLLKRDYHHRDKGKDVIDRRTKKYLGKVIYSDFYYQNVGLVLKKRIFRPFLAVDAVTPFYVLSKHVVVKDKDAD